jgi:hypothetical protein
VILKQFTARDVISKWDIIEARTRATSRTAKEFLDTVHRGMPFKIKAIQVDGGSEFYSEFEQEWTCFEKVESIYLLCSPFFELYGA